MTRKFVKGEIVKIQEFNGKKITSKIGKIIYVASIDPHKFSFMNKKRVYYLIRTENKNKKMFSKIFYRNFGERTSGGTMIVKMIKVINADRQAGWGVVERPPESWIGRVGMITRPLINWEGYWVIFYIKKGKKICEYKEVLHKDEFIEATEKETKEFNKLQIEYVEQQEAKMVAEKL